MTRKWGLSFGILAALGLIGWGVPVGYLWLHQESVLFHPEPLETSEIPRASDIREEWVEVPGARLHALHLRQPRAAGSNGGKGLVFYLHGNGGNVASWLPDPDFWRRSGYDLFLLDYRGFGRSAGTITSEAQLSADVLAAWRQVASEYAGRRIIVFGRSFGTGLATWLAQAVQPDLLVLVSPYSSMLSMKRRQFAWVPDFAVRYPLRSDQWIRGYGGPTLILAGERDETVPVAESLALLRQAHRGEFVLVPGAHHDDLQRFDLYRNALYEAFALH